MPRKRKQEQRPEPQLSELTSRESAILIWVYAMTYARNSHIFQIKGLHPSTIRKFLHRQFLLPAWQGRKYMLTRKACAEIEEQGFGVVQPRRILEAYPAKQAQEAV